MNNYNIPYRSRVLEALYLSHSINVYLTNSPLASKTKEGEGQSRKSITTVQVLITVYSFREAIYNFVLFILFLREIKKC